jgi:hypothetical protein
MSYSALIATPSKRWVEQEPQRVAEVTRQQTLAQHREKDHRSAERRRIISRAEEIAQQLQLYQRLNVIGDERWREGRANLYMGQFGPNYAQCQISLDSSLIPKVVLTHTKQGLTAHVDHFRAQTTVFIEMVGKSNWKLRISDNGLWDTTAKTDLKRINPDRYPASLREALDPPTIHGGRPSLELTDRTVGVEDGVAWVLDEHQRLRDSFKSNPRQLREWYEALIAQFPEGEVLKDEISPSQLREWAYNLFGTWRIARFIDRRIGRRLPNAFL